MNTNANNFVALLVIIQGLTRHRSDEMIEAFFELAKDEAPDKCVPPVLSFTEIEYFEIIGSLVGEKPL